MLNLHEQLASTKQHDLVNVSTFLDSDCKVVIKTAVHSERTGCVVEPLQQCKRLQPL